MERNQERQHIRVLGIVPLLLALIVGCGAESADRYDLSGKVTYKGQPVPIGFMVFEPDAQRSNSGPGARADIKDGKYSTPPNRGHIGGPHVVHIFGYDGIPYQLSEDGMMNPVGRPLFESKEVRADLPKEAAEQDFMLPQP